MNFIGQTVPGASAFMRRLYDAQVAHKNLRSFQRIHSRFLIPDFEWWLTFAKKFNGVGKIPSDFKVDPIHNNADARLSKHKAGIGLFYCGMAWFIEIPRELCRRYSANNTDLEVVAMSLLTFIIIAFNPDHEHCLGLDNSGSIKGAHADTMKRKQSMVAIRLTAHVKATYRIRVDSSYINTKFIISDHPSRGDHKQYLAELHEYISSLPTAAPFWWPHNLTQFPPRERTFATVHCFRGQSPTTPIGTLIGRMLSGDDSISKCHDEQIRGILQEVREELKAAIQQATPN
jgi:hypothetical protein